MSYCPVCADLLREKQELEARVRELEAAHSELNAMYVRQGLNAHDFMHRAEQAEAALSVVMTKIAGLVRRFDELADEAHAEPAFPSEARVTMAAAYRGCAHRLADECLATPPTNTGGGANGGALE